MQTEHIVQDDSSVNPTGSRRGNSLLCAVVETGARAWIDWPLHVDEVEPGTIVTVISHPAALFGPEDVRASHRGDEYVPVEELVAAVRTLALAALRFCGHG